MKELSIEEKAKAYDKVREKIALRFGSNVADEIFSQFEMSEDERIRKELISFLQLPHPQFVGERKQEDWIAWLEKQGSEENKGNLGGISPNSAWSEEDERNLEGIIDEIEANKNFAPDSDFVTYDRYLSWLKSLRTKNTWKPSDEQMDSLETAVSLIQSNSLESLYQDLKREKNYE